MLQALKLDQQLPEADIIMRIYNIMLLFHAYYYLFLSPIECGVFYLPQVGILGPGLILLYVTCNILTGIYFFFTLMIIRLLVVIILQAKLFTLIVPPWQSVKVIC